MNVVIYSEKKRKLKLYTNTKIYEFEKLGHNISSWVDSNDILIIAGLSLVSKTQLREWLRLDSWFSSFPKLSLDDALNMTLVLYNEKTELATIYDSEGISVFRVNDDSLFDGLPNKIGYIEAADLLTKKQFVDWLGGKKVAPNVKNNSSISEIAPKPAQSSKKYLHTVHDGTVLIEDIQVQGAALRLSGKWHFVPVSMIGEENLKSSVHFQVLEKKGKIEIVDEEYVQANKHKLKKPTSHVSTLPVGNVDDFLNGDDGDIIQIDVKG